MPANLGLTSYQAKQKLIEYGENILPEKPPPSSLSIFLSQLKSPLVYILIGAALVTIILGDYKDTLIIGIAVFINTILGFLQERKAENSLNSLKKLINPQAEVLRDGARKIIDVKEIVPGDLCILNSGDKVPADGRIIAANRFFVSEAILTGESVPVEKTRDSKVFMGTIVTSGEGKFIVQQTGSNSEIGKIAVSLQEKQEDTPLRRQLTIFSKQLTYLVIFLVIIVFIIGAISGMDLSEIFKVSVALAVSAIPEGLLVGLTVVLAIGMQRILQKKGLVRNLVSAETLGGVTTVCVDKTGTLTEGRLQLTDVIGNKVEIARQGIIANDLDDPILTTLWEWASKLLTTKDLNGHNIDSYLSEHPRFDSIPFSSNDRFFASLNKTGGTNMLFVNGAPEFLLKWSNVKKSDLMTIKKQIDKLTSEGKRVIGFARKKLPQSKIKINDNDHKTNLEWIGLVAFSDPVRNGVKEALAKIVDAKVKIVVITGDYSQTAKSVLKHLSINIHDENVVLGHELANISPSVLQSFLLKGNVKLFARTTPEQKLKIVDALKQNGEVVAMMGDGVNDAPALKKADIGIVVSDASDVAKDSSDIVLLDSSFATIVSAVEEGRGIFDNIRKIILYLMSGAFGEIIAVTGALVLGFPIPITAAQILWINLVSDGFPHLALTVDPKRKDIMKGGPRNPEEALISPWMKKLILSVSLSAGLISLTFFIVFFSLTDNLRLAQSMAFAAIGINSLVYVYSIRALDKPFSSVGIFENKWLNLAVISGFVLQIFPFVSSWGREFLGIVSLEFWHWIIILGSSLVMFILIEIFKKLIYKSEK